MFIHSYCLTAISQSDTLKIMIDPKTCIHFNKHTQMINGRPATRVGNSWMGKYYYYDIQEVPTVINTYCADCGEKLKTIIVKK